MLFRLAGKIQAMNYTENERNMLKLIGFFASGKHLNTNIEKENDGNCKYSLNWEIKLVPLFGNGQIRLKQVQILGLKLWFYDH